MRNHKVAIQGGVASFHDIAAKKYFGETIDTLECGTFKEVCEKIAHNQADFGIIAIENKIAGSILLNYHLIDSFDLKIIGEIYLPLELDLMAKPNCKISDIKEVISHPMAIGQCQEYLAKLKNVKVLEFKDTATSAKYVKESKECNLAVIGGPAIAKTYDLNTLEKNISDEKQNYTRFYILTKHAELEKNANKASITFTINDKVGSLAEILISFKNGGLNLSKIQSIPIPNQPTLYAFHVDLTFNSEKELKSNLEKIEPLTNRLKILGLYKGAILKLENHE